MNKIKIIIELLTAICNQKEKDSKEEITKKVNEILNLPKFTKKKKLIFTCKKKKKKKNKMEKSK